MTTDADSNHARAAGTALLADARSVISKVAGCQIGHASEIRHGVMTYKVLVETLNSERFVVRFYPPSRESLVNCEADLLERCRRSGLPVPSVIADSRTGPKAGLAYIAYPMIEGEMLASRLPHLSPSQRAALAVELARRLSDLQQIGFEGYGELLDSTTARDSSWLGFVRASVGLGLEALDAGGHLTASVVKRTRTVLDRVGMPAYARQGVLVWGDINYDNILVDQQGHIAGLIDFESCLSGDPMATLGCCVAITEPSAFVDSLIDAWPGGLSGEERERVALYAILRVLRLARYAHLPTPTGHPRDPLTRIFPGFVPTLSALAARVSAAEPK